MDAGSQVEQQPDDHNGGEGRAEPGSAEGLQQEEKDEDGAGSANDGGRLEVGVGDFEALDGTQDGLSRSEHAVGHHHRDTEDTNDLEAELANRGALDEFADAPSSGLKISSEIPLHPNTTSGGRVPIRRDVGVPRHKAVQCEGASLAIVVGIEDDEAILDTHEQGQGPDDEGEGTDKVIPGWLRAEGRGVHVKRGGANVTVNNTGRLESHPEEDETAVALQRSQCRRASRAFCIAVRQVQRRDCHTRKGAL